MAEATSGTPSVEGPDGNLVPALKVCTECGRETPKLTRKKCGACYMRALRGGEIARRVPLDPEIAALLLPVPGTSESFADRVFTYVDPTGDCWEWTGADQDDYGVIGRGGRGAGNIQAHRAVWELLVGQLPDDLQIDHLCRRHSCVNPDHLEPVTMAENKRRGFSPAVLYSKRDTCEFGHPLDGVLGGRGGKARHRYCKTCARERQAAINALKPPKPPRTHCNSGKHPWIPENIYIHPKRGTATCKACKIERQQDARESARQAA
jgi:hypothetical protein